MNILLFNKFALRVNGVIFVITMLVFAFLIKLGFWQLSRALEKETRLAKIAVYQQQEATGLRHISELKVDDETLNDLPVDLEGTFQNEYSFLLDNQTLKGRLGYRVLKIFEDEKKNLAVLVNLGWLEGSLDRSYLPEVKEISGQVHFKGWVRLVDSPITLADEQLKAGKKLQRIQTIDIPKLSDLSKMKLLPFVIYVDNNEDIGYIKSWTPIVMQPEKHRGYAFQWFSLATAWLILMFSAAFKSAKHEKKTS